MMRSSLRQFMLLPVLFAAASGSKEAIAASDCATCTRASTFVQTRARLKEQQARDEFCQGKQGFFSAPSEAEGNDDCRGFYHCFHGHEPMQLCAPGQRFNPVINVCDWAMNVECLGRPSTTVPTDEEATTTGSVVSTTTSFTPVVTTDAPTTTAAATTTTVMATTVTSSSRPTTTAPPVTSSARPATTTLPVTSSATSTLPVTSSARPATSTLPITSSARPLTTTLPGTGNSAVDAVVESLSAADSAGVFMYDTGNGWLESDVYTWPDMVKAVQAMATQGIGNLKLWVGDAGMTTYGLVNIAAFLAQCMQETIQYNACDENNWSDKQVVQEAGGSTYSAASACGQLHQSYQDYGCSAEEDELAGGRMACEVEPDMEMRASTQAQWYGAPAKLFCAPRSKVPKAPRWDYSAPWCPPEDGWGHEPAFPEDVDLATYFEYVKEGGSCKDYQGIKTGGWTFEGEGCQDGACPNSAAPLFGQPDGRTDVEGCCWWGRGVIQTTGVCNFGKLNFYMGKRAADEGRSALFPKIDLCKNPSAICDKDSPAELKWIAGFFYWMNSVQPYSSGGWSYMEELKTWVDSGMPSGDKSFINGASGIVNRGCHNPPNCGTGELHAGEERAANFARVLKAMGLA